MTLYVFLEEGGTSAAALYRVRDFSVLTTNQVLPHQLGGKQALPRFQVRS